MTDLVLAEIELPDEVRDDWAQALRDVLRSAAAVYTRHSAARALSSACPGSVRSLVLTEALLRLLTAAGFTAREGLVVVQRLGDAALAEAWAPPAQPMPGFPGLEAALRQTDPDDPGMFGIEMVIAGAHVLAAGRGVPRPASTRRAGLTTESPRAAH